MSSKELKNRAIAMRRRGASLRDVSARLGIQKSTLSYWFKNVILSKHHQALLKSRTDLSLVTARKAAVRWHNAGKEKRLTLAREAAHMTLGKLSAESLETAELALALLYLGEGMKKTSITSLGNSDPLILKFFVKSLRRIYNVPVDKIRCELHIRADQDGDKLRRYWSRMLKLPLANISGISRDTRTKGKPTYPHYKGVCIVRCGRVEIQRKLVYIATTFCEQFVNGMRG